MLLLLIIYYSQCMYVVITLYFLLIVSFHLVIELSYLYCRAIDCSLDCFLVFIIIIITKYNNLYTNYVLWTINDNTNNKNNESLPITIIIIINSTMIIIIAANDNSNLYTLLSLLKSDLLRNNKNIYINMIILSLDELRVIAKKRGVMKTNLRMT